MYCSCRTASLRASNARRGDSSWFSDASFTMPGRSWRVPGEHYCHYLPADMSMAREEIHVNGEGMRVLRPGNDTRASLPNLHFAAASVWFISRTACSRRCLNTRLPPTCEASSGRQNNTAPHAWCRETHPLTVRARGARPVPVRAARELRAWVAIDKATFVLCELPHTCCRCRCKARERERQSHMPDSLMRVQHTSACARVR